jgi:hypothetical protein
MLVRGMVQLAFLPFMRAWLSPSEAGELGVLNALSKLWLRYRLWGCGIGDQACTKAPRRAIVVLASFCPLAPGVSCVGLGASGKGITGSQGLRPGSDLPA